MAHYASFTFSPSLFTTTILVVLTHLFEPKMNTLLSHHGNTHTHARVMHNALCCSRFSVPPPPSARPVCSRLSDMTVPAGLLAAAEQGGGERERIQERKRDGDTAGQCEERMQRDGGGRRGLQRSGVCSVPHWSKTCCRTVPVGFFWDGKPLWVEQCSVYIKTAVSTGVCATSKHSTHRWLTLSN